MESFGRVVRSPTGDQHGGAVPFELVDGSQDGLQRPVEVENAVNGQPWVAHHHRAALDVVDDVAEFLQRRLDGPRPVGARFVNPILRNQPWDGDERRRMMVEIAGGRVEVAQHDFESIGVIQDVDQAVGRLRVAKLTKSVDRDESLTSLPGNVLADVALEIGVDEIAEPPSVSQASSSAALLISLATVTMRLMLLSA